MRNLPWAEILVIGLAVGLGAGVYLYAHRDEGSLEASKNRGAELVTALTAYMDEHGTYPEQLADLVPQYVAEVRPPVWGLERWRYRRYTPASVSAPAPASGDATGGAGQDSADASRIQDDADANGELYFQLSVAADESGYPVLYYDFAARRWVLNN